MQNQRVVVSRYGGPEELRLVEEDLPEAKAGEVRIKVLAAGVSLPDLMMREGFHPETPALPFTPGWDVVGVAESGAHKGRTVAALPIFGGYTRYICLPERGLVPVPAGLDAAEAVSLVLNYVTAYQMLHRSVALKPGMRALIHGASGGVGTALLQLGKLMGLEMFGTCSQTGAKTVIEHGAIPIDYKTQDFVAEVRRRTGDGVDAAFDGIGGDNVWRSRETLRPGGAVVAYGLTGSLSGGRKAGPGAARRNRLHAVGEYARAVIASRFMPGRKRIDPYSIQWRMRLKRAEFRQDLAALLDLLKEGKIKPLVAQRFALEEARRAQELLGKGGVAGKFVIVNT